MTTITIDIPMQVISEANNRDHWSKKARRAREQRNAVRAIARAKLPAYVTFKKMSVTFTRLGVKKLDSDNLARAFKAVRDGLADALRVDDGDERITWNYQQEKGKGKGYAIRIRVEWEWE